MEAIVLGLVQGLTEFLPVSSSGHLNTIPYLLTMQQPSIAFTVALHAGTLLAVIAYFAGDLWYLATRIFGVGSEDAAETRRARQTVLLLGVASIPAGLFGFFLDATIEERLADPRQAAALLFVTGGTLLFAEKTRKDRAIEKFGADAEPAQLRADLGRAEDTVDLKDALAMGVAQALAIFPGISRAGSTISAGMIRGMSRQGAARFSFLMSIPVIVGATIFKIGDLSEASNQFTSSEVAIGMTVAAVSGYWAIRYLLRLISTEDLRGFANYVFLYGAAVLIGSIWIGPPSTIG